MKITARILILILLVVCHFVGTTLFVWSSAVLYLVIALLSVVSVIQFWKSNKSLEINIPEIFLLIFILYVFLNNSLKGTFSGNASLFHYLIFLLLYFSFVFLYNNDKALFKFLFLGLFFGFLIELLAGFGQLFGIIANSDSKFVLGGLFGNPGAFAGYLTIVFSFLLAIVFFYKDFFKSENLQYIIVFSLFCALSLIFLCDSRGAWVACFVSTVFLFNKKYAFTNTIRNVLKTKISKIIAGFILFLTIVVVSIALYHYKKESAEGRLFIWKISKDMAIKKPLFGSGSGSFEANYGKAQASYFLGNKALESEVQIADYVTCAYNEFLEMFIELGATGLTLFLAILYFALTTRQNKNSSKYTIAAKASLLSLLVLSMVSYPFNLIPNILHFIICLFIILKTGEYNVIIISKYSKFATFGLLLAILALVYGGSRQLYGMHHFRNGYAKVLNHDFDGGISDYKKAEPFLKNNGEFQFYYGSALYLKHDYSESIFHLQKAVNLQSDPNGFILLGNAFQKLKQYNKAEYAYRMATGITPAKLYPKYLLTKLYIEIQQKNKALEVAKKIISTNEKTPTTAGSEIKTEMKVLIKQYSKLNVKPLK